VAGLISATLLDPVTKVWGEEHFAKQQLVMQTHPLGGQGYFLETHTMFEW